LERRDSEVHTLKRKDREKDEKIEYLMEAVNHLMSNPNKRRTPLAAAPGQVGVGLEWQLRVCDLQVEACEG